MRLKKARWLERLVPFLRPDGASLVPGHAVTAPGQSFADRIATARDEMDRSEQIAAAVALQAAGKNVDAAPRGALVESVAIDVRGREHAAERRRDRRGRGSRGAHAGRPPARASGT